MKPSEEEMILHIYGEGEAAQAAAIESALAADPVLRRELEALRRELDGIPPLDDPEPSGDLAGRVWRELRPRLRPHRPSWRTSLSRLAGLLESGGIRPAFAIASTCALLAAVALGFVLGRSERTHFVTTESTTAALSAEARERLLFAALSDHLGGSERLFVSIANAPADGDPELLRDKSRWAASLAASNRLYRHAADRAGQRRIVSLLDELEPLLLELANSAPAAADGGGAAAARLAREEISAAQQRIEEKDLLFKLRIAGSRLERPASTRPITTSSSS